MAQVTICDYCNGMTKKPFGDIKVSTRSKEQSESEKFELCRACYVELVDKLEGLDETVAPKKTTQLQSSPKAKKDNKPPARRPEVEIRTECDSCRSPVEDDHLGILTCTSKSCGKRVSRTKGKV